MRRVLILGLAMAALGTYFLNVDGQRAIRAERVK